LPCRVILSKMFMRIYNEGEGSEKILDAEYQLLGCILLKLFPSIAEEFFDHPNIARKRLHLSIAVLFQLTIGYF